MNLLRKWIRTELIMALRLRCLGLAFALACDSESLAQSERLVCECTCHCSEVADPDKMICETRSSPATCGLGIVSDDDRPDCSHLDFNGSRDCQSLCQAQICS